MLAQMAALSFSSCEGPPLYAIGRAAVAPQHLHLHRARQQRREGEGAYLGRSWLLHPAPRPLSSYIPLGSSVDANGGRTVVVESASASAGAWSHCRNVALSLAQSLAWSLAQSLVQSLSKGSV
jgi:hypothetical protein